MTNLVHFPPYAFVQNWAPMAQRADKLPPERALILGRKSVLHRHPALGRVGFRTAPSMREHPRLRPTLSDSSATSCVQRLTSDHKP
jgi:hypothetical protein